MSTVYFKEAKYEFLKMLRQPGFAVPTLVFPLMFYVLFGLLLPSTSSSGPRAAQYLMATYGTFGVMGVALFGFGVGIASERGFGWLELKQASPMPPFSYFLAKLAMAALFSLIIVMSLFGLGLTFGHVHMPALQFGHLLGILVLGSIPFGALGLFIGYLAPATAAPAIVNCLYLPMSFLSGLWVPIQFLPQWMQNLAVVFPPYHLSQLALGVFGAADDHWTRHAIALAGSTLLFLGGAWFASGSRIRTTGRITATSDLVTN